MSKTPIPPTILINKPRQVGPYPDRLVDCEWALEDAFLDLVNRAMAQGWTPIDATVALTNLSDNLILKMAAVEDTTRSNAESRKGL